MIEHIASYTKTLDVYGIASQDCTYRVYRAPSEEEAIEFLSTEDVDEPYVYVVVETPEGCWGRDVVGIYSEDDRPSVQAQQDGGSGWAQNQKKRCYVKTGPELWAKTENGRWTQIGWHYEEVGRNEPCPCGSGKKYKHCCEP